MRYAIREFVRLQPCNWDGLILIVIEDGVPLNITSSAGSTAARNGSNEATDAI